MREYGEISIRGSIFRKGFEVRKRVSYICVVRSFFRRDFFFLVFGTFWIREVGILLRVLY